MGGVMATAALIVAGLIFYLAVGVVVAAGMIVGGVAGPEDQDDDLAMAMIVWPVVVVGAAGAFLMGVAKRLARTARPLAAWLVRK